MKINMKMKMLSLAVVGLGGLALAGSAAAACPAGPTAADGGAWTDATSFQGAMAIVSPGLDSTACRLDVSLSASAGVGAAVVVHDDSPSNEPSYRAQFTINVDQLTTKKVPGFSDAVQVFSATTAGQPVRFGLFGNGSAWNLSYSVGSGVSGSVPLPAGSVRVEFALTVNASGSFNVWVNNNTEGSPNKSYTSIDTSSLVGVNDAYMGLSAPSGFFVQDYAATPAEFDQFDSRRATFIGF